VRISGGRERRYGGATIVNVHNRRKRAMNSERFYRGKVWEKKLGRGKKTGFAA
jgi:hypothetical protein